MFLSTDCVHFQLLCRFSGVEKLKDKAAAAAQAILEPGIATDGGQHMSREQFGLFIRRFAAASGFTFSAITDFLLVVPVFDYDPAFTDPGKTQEPWLVLMPGIPGNLLSALSFHCDSLLCHA